MAQGMTAAIAAAFNRGSPLNVATPCRFTTSTELIEIEAILLGLKQSRQNNLKHIHITVDNLSALRFLKESMTLSIQNSKYLQEKTEFNAYFKEANDQLLELKNSFEFLSASHTKSHTKSLTLCAQLNSLADKLARSCQTSFSNMIRKADRADTPLSS